MDCSGGVQFKEFILLVALIFLLKPSVSGCALARLLTNASRQGTWHLPARAASSDSDSRVHGRWANGVSMTEHCNRHDRRIAARLVTHPLSGHSPAALSVVPCRCISAARRWRMRLE